MRIVLVILIVAGFVSISIGQTVIPYRYPVIQAGQVQGNSIVPYCINGDNSSTPNCINGDNNIVLFKGETEIVLGPGSYTGANNEFSALGYTTNASQGYFRAYLVPPISYYELKKSLDGNFTTTIENVLYFKYIEKFSDGGILNYQIYDFQRNKMLATFNLPTITMGANFFSIDISKVTAINAKDLSQDQNTFYTLEVLNGKGELFVLRFKYIRVL